MTSVFLDTVKSEFDSFKKLHNRFARALGLKGISGLFYYYSGVYTLAKKMNGVPFAFIIYQFPFPFPFSEVKSDEKMNAVLNIVHLNAVL